MRLGWHTSAPLSSSSWWDLGEDDKLWSGSGDHSKSVVDACACTFHLMLFLMCVALPIILGTRS